MNKRDSLRYIIGGEGGWPLGAGALTATPGAYQIGSNFDGRFGIPGPREIADLTGIAAAFRVYQMLKHADTTVVITSDGTDTKVYREETTWVLKATISSRVPYGPQSAISFKSVLAIGFTGTNPYQYTADVGAGAWTFTASTKTAGNADRANVFLEQSNGFLTPHVVYLVSPNELYTTEDLTNTDGVGVNPTYVGDTSATANFPTSLAEEPGTGRLLIGMRHALYTIHFGTPGYEGIWERLTENFSDPLADAGGQSDRRNFEGPATVAGVVYYPVQGYEILAWHAGFPYDRYLAPRHVCGAMLPRFDLPINALLSASGYLIAFLGSKNSASLKAVTYAPGGNSRLANTFTVNSDMWVGVPTTGRMIWHGVLLECSNPLRYAWFDEDSNLIYLASGDSESINVQMTRCLFPIDNPVGRLTLGAIALANGTVKLEPGPIDFGDKWTSKRAEHIRVMALGLAASAPSIEVEYSVLPDYLTTAFDSNFVTFTDALGAELGAAFPDETIGRSINLRFVMTGSSDTYAIFREAELRATLADNMDEQARRH